MNPLNQIGEILRNPEHRCREHYAMSSEYNATDDCTPNGTGLEQLRGNSPSAERFCLVGAMQKVSNSDEPPEALVQDVAACLGVTARGGMWHGTLIVAWDEAADEEQDLMVQKLLEAK